MASWVNYINDGVVAYYSGTRQRSKYYIPEKWGAHWAVLTKLDGHIFKSTQDFGWKEYPIKIGDANPPKGTKGVLYLHPLSETKPNIIEGKFKINYPNTILKLRVAGNKNGDWKLRVKINNISRSKSFLTI